MSKISDGVAVEAEKLGLVSEDAGYEGSLSAGPANITLPKDRLLALPKGPVPKVGPNPNIAAHICMKYVDCNTTQ